MAKGLLIIPLNSYPQLSSGRWSSWQLGWMHLCLLHSWCKHGLVTLTWSGIDTGFFRSDSHPFLLSVHCFFFGSVKGIWWGDGWSPFILYNVYFSYHVFYSCASTISTFSTLSAKPLQPTSSLEREQSNQPNKTHIYIYAHTHMYICIYIYIYIYVHELV